MSKKQVWSLVNCDRLARRCLAVRSGKREVDARQNSAGVLLGRITVGLLGNVRNLAFLVRREAPFPYGQDMDGNAVSGEGLLRAVAETLVPQRFHFLFLVYERPFQLSDVHQARIFPQGYGKSDELPINGTFRADGLPMRRKKKASRSLSVCLKASVSVTGKGIYSIILSSLHRDRINFAREIKRTLDI